MQANPSSRMRAPANQRAPLVSRGHASHLLPGMQCGKVSRADAFFPTGDTCKKPFSVLCMLSNA